MLGTCIDFDLRHELYLLVMTTSVTPSLARYEPSEGIQSLPPSVTTTLEGRAYQLEMLDESMKRNIIIAAETGSGKTLMYWQLS